MRVNKTYRGYWDFQRDAISVAGILTVGKDITLNLVDLNKLCYTLQDIHCLRGVAIDDNNDTYFFLLYDLTYIASMNSSQGLQTYEFSVSYLVLSSQSCLHEIRDNILKTDKIIVNNSNLNWWCKSLIKEQEFDIKLNKLNYNYIQPKPVLLSELDDCNIYAFISSSTGTPRHDGFFNKLESHLEITFGDTLELRDTFKVLHKIERLLSLFMTNPVVNESISFTSNETYCTCIHNITVNHYNYRQSADNERMFTSSIRDITDNQIIKNWCDFYDVEQSALNLFFDTVYNEELTDELRIICYSSVLEELTKRYYIPNQPIRETRKRKMLQDIIDILKADHHRKEANDLKTGYLDKDDTFESRLFFLLQK